MKKLFITGASGFLGWNLCREARGKWDIFGATFSHQIDIAGVKTFRIDLADFKELKRIFSEIRPDALIHTAAVSNANFCQLNRAATHKINVDSALNLAGLCADAAIPLAFTSTDLVFDGLGAPYREEDPVSPVNVYGEQKAMAERGILERYPKAAICRMPLMFGDPGPVAVSFIQPMLDAMQKGLELRLFIDEFRTPVSGRDAAGGLLMAIEKVGGIIHLGGIERISRFDFGRMLGEVFNFPNARLLACRQGEIQMAAPRSPDVSLDSSKAFRLGFKPGKLREELEALRAGRNGMVAL